MNENKYFCPITSPERNETAESILNRWDKFDLLKPKDQDKVSSGNSANKIKHIGSIFRLTPLQTGCISIAIRNYYFGELLQKDFPAYLSREIPIDIAKAQEIARAVFQRIIDDTTQEETAQSQIEKTSLSSALKKYPELGEQLITNNRIALRNMPEAVRPSIKNWLSDYTFTMGFDPHDSAARGTYLFQNQNTRHLTRPEQAKLNYILKSFDTQENVEINIDLKQIVFPRVEMPQKTVQKSNVPHANNVSPSRINQKTTSNIFRNTAKPNLFSKKPTPTPTSKPSFSGTFTITRKNSDEPKASIERKLPTASKNDFLPSAKMQFTSPHKMPFEKQSPQVPTPAPSKKPTSLQPTPAQPIIAPQPAPPKPTEPPKPEPLKITPRYFRNSPADKKDAPLKNVVNLKEK